MMKNVNIALIGAGFVCDFYMQGLSNVAGQAVQVVYSRTHATAAALAKKWGIPEISTDLDAVIGRDDIDLYVIGVPNYAHMEISLKLSAAGKNQVCTKPLARNAEEARIMYEAAVKAGAIHGYAETEVFAPAVVKARDIVVSGGIGDVKWVRSRESHSGPHSEHFWNPDLSGGGALVDMGCHCIEAARYFIGKDVRPKEVFAWGDTMVHEIRGEDNALAIIRFENGSIGHLEVSWTSKGGLDLRNEVHGSDGAVFTDITRGTPIHGFTTGGSGYIVEKADAETGWVYPVPEEAFTYGYQAEMKHFVECVREGKRPRETYEDGYIVNAVMDAAYRSMKSGAWEPIEYTLVDTAK